MKNGHVQWINSELLNFPIYTLYWIHNDNITKMKYNGLILITSSIIMLVVVKLGSYWEQN